MGKRPPRYTGPPIFHAKGAEPMIKCQWDCPPTGHQRHCFLNPERQALMSDEYREGMVTALDRACRVCKAKPGEQCWSNVVLRATGQSFGTLREPHLERVLAR